jgi:hypothetical protein
MANLLGTTVNGSLLIGPSGTSHAYDGAATGKLYFGNQVSDSPTHYHITTNMENYNGNYSKLDIRWYTGQRFYAHTGYGGFRFHEITTAAELFSVGKGDSHVRVANNLYVGNTIYNNGNAVIHAGNIGSQSVNYASESGITEFQKIPDRRGDAYQPNDYAGNRVWWHFNNKDTVGGYGTYWHAIQTVSPWSSYDSSHRQQQIQWGGTDISFRYATSGTTWSSWFRFITDASIASQSVNYAASAGSAGTAGSAGSVDGLTINNSGAPINPDNVTQNQIGYNTSVELFSQTDGGLYSSAYSSSWIHQIYGDFRTGQMAIRGKNANTWQAWRIVLDDKNIGSYAVPYGNMTSSTGLSDNKLYLRTNGDNNHYLWNAADDWEEMVYYTGTGFRVKGSTGTVSATFTDSGINLPSGSVAQFYTAAGSLRGYIQATDTDDNHFIIATSGGEDIVFKDGGLAGERNMVIRGNASVEAYGDFRAPIFYDSADTGYYLDPNGSSVLNGTVVIKGNDNQLAIDGTTGALASGLFFRESGNNKYELYHYNGEFRFYNYTTGQQEMSINNASGFITARTSFRAPIFYDSENTGYYVDPNSTSSLYRVNSYYLSNQGDVSDNHPYGMYFASNLSNAYAIYRESGSWTWPYPDLRIAFHTGIKIGANASYEGIRFYTDYDMSSQVMSVNNGSDPLGGGNVYVNNSLQAGSSLRAPIFYDSNDTNYYLDPTSTGTALRISGGIVSTAGNGAVLLKHENSEANAWIFRENAANWGLFWFNAGGQSGQSIGSYTTVGAELFGMNNAVTGFNPSSAWSGTDASTRAAWMLSNYSGYLWTQGTQYSETDMRAPIFYDSQDTGFYVDPNSESRLYRLNVGGSGHSLENTEAVLKFRNTSSPHNYIVSQGSTWGSWNQWIRYVGDYNTWRIGTYDEAQESGTSVWRLAGRNRSSNSEINYIVAGPRGAWGSSDRVVLWNPYARYDGGSFNGDGTHYQVITAANIGSQSVSNADTVDSLHASSFVRNDTTGQYLRAYYQYGNYLTSERPIDLRNQMGGSGMRVDFMIGAGGGSWNHVITFSGYDAYNMYQLGGYYDGGSATNLYVRSEANHGTTSWTAWRRLLNEVADPYAVNMNQYVRTTDSPTFAEVYNNGWFRTVGHQGLYNPTNNAHFYPNNASYGSWRIDGSRNGWHGIHFDSGATLMMNSNESGVHRESYGWQFRWENGTMYCHKNSYGGGTSATVLDTSNFTNWAAASSGNTGVEFGSRSLFFSTTNYDFNLAPRASISSMSIKLWDNYFNGSGLGSDYGSLLDIYGRGGHVHSQFYMDANNGIWYRSSPYAGGWNSWAQFLTAANFTTWAQEKENQRLSTSSDVTHNSTTSATILVNNQSDNTKGYRIWNTSNTSVSAMFVNSSNQLVIAAGAVDQVNLNKKVLVNGVALGVNVAPSATAGRIDASNDIVAYSTSDERFKENITPISNALDKVKTLTGVEFDWRMETKDYHGYVGHDVGVIAQQVKAVLPEAVRTNANGYLAVRYEKLIGLLIEANKELAARVEELEKKLG